MRNKATKYEICEDCTRTNTGTYLPDINITNTKITKALLKATQTIKVNNNELTKHKLSQETQQLIEQRMALLRDRTNNKKTTLQMNKTTKKK